MKLLQKIERLQKRSRVAKAVKENCPHVYTLKMFGEITSDPPPCRCATVNRYVSLLSVAEGC